MKGKWVMKELSITSGSIITEVIDNRDRREDFAVIVEGGRQGSAVLRALSGSLSQARGGKDLALAVVFLEGVAVAHVLGSLPTRRLRS